jgi:hypothetical protein
VIGAGPAVNVAIAFLILFGLGLANEKPTTLLVGEVTKGTPAAQSLQDGDEVVSIDGVTGGDAPFSERATTLSSQVGDHTCAGGEEDGCRASTPAEVVVIRDGQEKTLQIRPYYDGEFERYRLGYQFEPGGFESRSVPEATVDSLDFMWLVTSETVSTFAQIFKPE